MKDTSYQLEMEKASYYKDSVFRNQQDFITHNMQITKFCSKNLDVINVYRSSKGNSMELLNKLIEMVDSNKSTLITALHDNLMQVSDIQVVDGFC